MNKFSPFAFVLILALSFLACDSGIIGPFEQTDSLINLDPPDTIPVDSTKYLNLQARISQSSEHHTYIEVQIDVNSILNIVLPDSNFGTFFMFPTYFDSSYYVSDSIFLAQYIENGDYFYGINGRISTQESGSGLSGAMEIYLQNRLGSLKELNIIFSADRILEFGYNDCIVKSMNFQYASGQNKSITYNYFSPSSCSYPRLISEKIDERNIFYFYESGQYVLFWQSTNLKYYVSSYHYDGLLRVSSECSSGGLGETACVFYQYQADNLISKYWRYAANGSTCRYDTYDTNHNPFRLIELAKLCQIESVHPRSSINNPLRIDCDQLYPSGITTEIFSYIYNNYGYPVEVVKAGTHQNPWPPVPSYNLSISYLFCD